MHLAKADRGASFHLLSLILKSVKETILFRQVASSINEFDGSRESIR